MQYIINSSAIFIEEYKRTILYLGHYKTSTLSYLVNLFNSIGYHVVFLDNNIQIETENGSIFVSLDKTKITIGTKQIKWWEDYSERVMIPANSNKLAITDIIMSVKGGHQFKLIRIDKELASYLIPFIDVVNKDQLDRESILLRDPVFLQNILPEKINYYLLVNGQSTEDEGIIKRTSIIKSIILENYDASDQIKNFKLENHICNNWKIIYFWKLFKLINITTSCDFLIIGENFWDYYCVSYDQLKEIVNLSEKIRKIDKDFTRINGVGVCNKCKNDHIIALLDSPLPDLVKKCPICGEKLEQGYKSSDIMNILNKLLLIIRLIPRNILSLLTNIDISSFNDLIILDAIISSHGCLYEFIKSIER